VPGKVKTRLAKFYGDNFASGFYKLCVEKLIEDFKNTLPEMNSYIFCSDKNETRQVKKWLGESFLYFHQSGNNLGERMKNAFEKTFDKGYDNAIIIGTYIPGINSNLVIKSFKLLDKYDCVIGPSSDGGYYLLGIKKKYPYLFENINWSTGTVLSDTIKKLKSKKLTYFLLEELIDIDTADDLKDWFGSQKLDAYNPLADYVRKFLIGR